QAENVRKMIVAMAGDIRVLLIKLADRLHNMRTLSALSVQKQHENATETLDIFAPLAHRLGVQQIRWELEDLSFKTLHPGPYREIANLVERRRGERQQYIDGVLQAARQRLREAGVKADVDGRPKHLYSIYEKMVVGGKEFNEIYDLAGVRVLVDSMRDCYGALGAIHSLWKPVPGRFKDYVAMPKSNMYQSLHTTVVGPQGRPIEVQIRTREMHRTAEFGIAAHWRYKERQDGKKAKEAADLAWLGQMLEWLKDMADPREFMEGLKIDLYGGQVFVFTPKGDVINLPAGATPVDFAYAIHTEVGHRTVGAKVSGKLVPLDYELRTGDSVEIITSKAQGEGPSQDWLKFVKTPRARTKIRQWFSRERREDALDEGRELLQRSMRKQNVPFKRLATEEAMRQVAEEMKFPDLEALYVAVGEGHVSTQSVLARLTRIVSGTPEHDVTEVPLSRPVTVERHDVTSGVVVPGSADVWVRLARCCTPVPGDEILGFVTRGQGVSVHRTDCPNAKALASEPERLMDVSWRPGRSTSFIVAIKVEALDRTRLLSDVATVLSDQHVNIISATSSVGRDRVTTLRFTFELGDIGHLSQILGAVKRVENVYDAYRVVPR
ncbi:MAG TPA: bifunctional (p)ppGpp synthetase/guanosine-3',5'-bis(diphosphate) 3'-pyrophosphohydrolase, partial [Actinomycetota bacterium]|nr:bifunctional (p)ppGpp synthetase/guanosine-3',5'-bis(diphosphate) 3'-pyrophosphohydrolase [Actinomycetota bacterium]